jgi:ATP-dependent exoDNAse (exonuclease V) alpha subunit
VQYNHAITVHRSQGSTYKTSIINVDEIKRNTKEYNKMMYTALTRASDRNILV